MRGILRRLLVLLTTVGVGAVLVTMGASGPAQAVTTKHANLLVPLYDNADPANWMRACSQANGSGGGSWIIADPAQGDGPGAAPSANWAKVISDCYKYGRASVIGYVWTNYGRDGQAGIAGIEQQIDKYYSFYRGNIAGIFFDGVSDTVPESGVSNQAFYQTLASYVHSRTDGNDEVVFNFGANPGSDWMLRSTTRKNADIVVTFEGSYNTPGWNPYVDWQPAAWEARYPASDFAALIYDAPNTPDTPQPVSACTRLKTQRVGFVYVGTWYSELAPYYADLATAC
jgi:Spherulation-specific family 4